MTPWAKVFLGIVFLLLGLGYLHRPGLIGRMTEFIREQILNDARISLERRKWGMFFLLLSFLFMYLGWMGLRAG